MSFEVPGSVLTKKYIDIWSEYSIGKQKFLNNICKKNTDNGCLDGELLWVKIISNNEAYIYFKLNYSIGSLIHDNWKKEMVDINYNIYIGIMIGSVQKI